MASPYQTACATLHNRMNSLATIFASAGLSAVTGFLTSRLTQHRDQRLKAYTYRAAIVSEIRTLHTRLTEYERIFEERVIGGQLTGAEVLGVLLQSGDMAVFANGAASIGLLDPRVGLRVLRFYAGIRALQGHARIIWDLARRDEGYELQDAVQRHRAMVHGLQRRAVMLVRRLRRSAIPLNVTLVYLLFRHRRSSS